MSSTRATIVGSGIALLFAACRLTPPAPPSESPPPVPVAAATRPLPAEVDLRPQFAAFGLLPRGQGPRPTCSVFTVTAAFEFAFARASGRGERLSAEYLNWAANAATGRTDDGDFFHFTLTGYERFGACRDELMPYGALFTGAAPSPDALVDAGRHLGAFGSVVAVRWVRPIGGAPGLSEAQFEELKRTLAAGWPVAAGAAHSRLLVGYRLDAAAPGGGVFLTLDSALAAYAEVTAEYVRTQVCDAFTVEVAGRQGDAGRDPGQ